MLGRQPGREIDRIDVKRKERDRVVQTHDEKTAIVGKGTMRPQESRAARSAGSEGAACPEWETWAQAARQPHPHEDERLGVKILQVLYGLG
jgi:hypothetical protein